MVQYTHFVRLQTFHLSNTSAAETMAESRLDTRARPNTMYKPRTTSSNVCIPDDGSRPLLGTISPNPIVLNAEREQVNLSFDFEKKCQKTE